MESTWRRVEINKVKHILRIGATTCGMWHSLLWVTSLSLDDPVKGIIAKDNWVVGGTPKPLGLHRGTAGHQG